MDRLRVGKAWNRGGLKSGSREFLLLRQTRLLLAPTQPPFEWLRGLSPFEIWRLVLEPDNSATPCEGLMKLSFCFPLRFISDMPRCLVSIPLFVIGVVCSWMLSRHPQIVFLLFYSGDSANHEMTYSNESLPSAPQLLNFTEHRRLLTISYDK